MELFSLKKIRILVFVMSIVTFYLLAYEVYFVVTNSNHSDIHPDEDMPPQENTSGLFSSYLLGGDEYLKMKAKCAVLIDFDRDNDLDLYYGYANSYYFENEAGFFTDKTDDYEIESSGSTGLISGDMDNNGYPDILRWRFTPSTSTSLDDVYDTEFDNSPHLILMNNGNHTFEVKEYLPSHTIPFIHSQGFLDFDLDGDLDIAVIQDKYFNQFHLFLNDGFNNNNEPLLREAYVYSRLDTSSSRTLAIVDYDNDGDQDIFIARKFGINWLFENQTLVSNGNEVIYNSDPNPLFNEVALIMGIGHQDAGYSGSTGYGASWGDYDNDNDFDLYLSNWGDNILFENIPSGPFINTSSTLNVNSDSLSNGSGWGDFNNDGYLDIWAANIKKQDDLYLNLGDGNWDSTYSPVFYAATQDILPADYNNDGWLDVFAPGLRMIGSDDVAQFTSILYKNISSESNNNHWLKLDLEGSKIGIDNNGWTNQSNKSAIGARIIVHLPDKNLSREIIAGKGHGSMDPLQLHFGLGQWEYIDSITIKWPSVDNILQQPKTISYIGPIDADKRYTVFEEIPYLFTRPKGDANNDDLVNILDVLKIIEYLFNEIEFTDEEIWSADLAIDSMIDITDIVSLAKFITTH